MFTNLLKRVATRDYLLFAEATFTYVFGEKTPKIEITTFDLAGNKVKKVDWREVTDDISFVAVGCGGYIPIWIGQLIDSTVQRSDNKFITSIFRLEDTFTTSNDTLEFSSCYSQIDSQIQSLVITNQAKVHFLLHKTTRIMMVSTINTPLLKGDECDYLLLLLLIEFMNKQYLHSAKVIKDMGRELFRQFKENPDVVSHPMQLRANDIVGNYLR